MKPKDKAMELMLKYYKLIPMNTVSFSKQCAIVAVDEIISNSLEWMGCEQEDEEILYWKEVKQYITEI